VDLSDSVGIQYYSDYYFASGSLKEVLYTNQKGRKWSAAHFASTNEKYFIKVKYYDTIVDSLGYRVTIYSDDIILDSIGVRNQGIELSGQVK